MNQKIDHLFLKYQNLSAPVKAAFWFTVCSILQKGIALLSTPIFTRLLTTSQYGVYTIYQSWYSIVTIFATLSLAGGVYNNGLTKYPEDKLRFTSSLQGLSTTVTTILFLIYIFNITFWNTVFGLSTIFIVAMFIECLFVPAFSFWSTGQRYNYEYKKLIVITLIMALGSPIIGIITVLETNYKAEARVLSYVLVQVAIGLIFYIWNFIKGKIFYHKSYWKFALAINLPLIPHYLSMTVLNQADRIMIDKMVGSGEAAIYAVAYTVSSMMTIITTAINNSFIPYTYKCLKSGEYNNIRKNANVLLMLVGFACIVAMAFGPELIKIVATEEYYDAIWIIPPVAASVYFMFLYPLFANVEFYYEKTIYIMIASGIGAILNIVLNYFFIPYFGYYAAGYTTLFCYILFAFAHYYFQKRVLNENIKNGYSIYDVRFVIILSVGILITMIFMTVIYRYRFLRYGVIAIGCSICFIMKDKILKILQEIKKM